MKRGSVPVRVGYVFSVVLPALVTGINWLSTGAAPMVLALAAVIATALVGGAGPGVVAAVLTTLGTGMWLWIQDDPEPGSSVPVEMFRLTLLALEGALFSLLVYRLNQARQRAEASARESRGHLASAMEAQARLRMVLDNVPASVFMKDLDGRYLLVNPRFVDMTGLPSDEVIGRTDEEIWPPEIASGFRHQDRLAVTSGVIESEDRHRMGDMERVFLTTRFPMIDCLGQAYSICGLRLDITERHRLEVDLRKARDDAEAANRAKDRFLAVLSHELRTPLTPVLVAVSGLLDGTIRDGLKPTLEMVRRNIELEAHLIDDLLDISQVVRGGMRLDLEVLDAHEVLLQSLEICRPETDRARLQLDLDLAAVRPLIRADRDRLLQLFWNLIHNAIKFNVDGGRFSISSRSDRDDGSGWLRLEFEDSGIGLSPEALEGLFLPFEQAWVPGRGRPGGLGLGLAISRSIAEAHEGRLSATSPGLGLGTRFLLELPLAQDVDEDGPSSIPDRRELDRLHETEAENPSGPLHILLVEDNPDTLRYLDIVLSRMGHRVRSAASISAALDAAAEHAYDLVLSDIELPDGTGLELMQSIASTRNTPGIAMSGFGSEEDTRLSLSAGFSLHLTKPLDTSRLEQAIRQVAGSTSTSESPTSG